jgi:hypothetical protein
MGGNGVKFCTMIGTSFVSSVDFSNNATVVLVVINFNIAKYYKYVEISVPTRWLPVSPSKRITA